jgi:hypothetical protein
MKKKHIHLKRGGGIMVSKNTPSWGLVLMVITPLLLLRDIHSKLLTQYDYKEVCARLSLSHRLT